MRPVHPEELQQISGGLLPLALVPLLGLAFGLGLGTGMMLGGTTRPPPAPEATAGTHP